MHSDKAPPGRRKRPSHRRVTRHSHSEHWPGRSDVRPRSISSNDRVSQRNTNLCKVHNDFSYTDPSIHSSHHNLRPARDAGLSLQTREDRRLVRERVRRQRIYFFAALGALLLFVIGFIWMQYSDRFTSSPALANLESSSVVATETANSAQADTSENLDVTPTPIMANYQGMHIYLPVELETLTEIAFHPANYAYALKFESHMPEANLAEAREARSTGRDIRTQSHEPNALLVGKCLKLWRSGRKASVMTAVDVGGAVGSPVLASIDGTITAVTVYSYEGKTDDYQIHIASSSLKGVELVIIHIQDVVVQEGDVVVAGITPLGTVRNIAQFTRTQLASYAGEEGNHVHLQLNDTTHAAYKARFGDNGSGIITSE